MTDKKLVDGQPVPGKKYTSEGRVRAPSSRRGPANGYGRAQGISPARLGRWQRAALAQAVHSSAEREESKRLRAELKRVEIERDS